MRKQPEPSLKNLASLLDLEAAAKLGDLLSPESAEVIERALVINALDLINRARLLGFYKRRLARRRHRNTTLYESRQVTHILWFIKNIPECAFCSDDYFAVKSPKAYGYKKVAAAWRASVRRHSGDAQVLTNAAMFFLTCEPDVASKLAQSALKIDQQNSWASSILNTLDSSSSSKGDYLYDLTEVVHVPDRTTLKRLKDRESAFLHDSFRCKLSEASVKTLTRLLKKYPTDVNARANLIAYYGGRCVLQNMFGVNPEFERQFVVHLAWFIKFALGAEGLDSVSIPELSARGRYTLVHLLRQHRSKTLGTIAAKNKAFLLKALKVKSEADKIKHLRWLKKRGYLQNEPGILDTIAVTSDRPKLSACPFSEEYTLTEWSNDAHLEDGKLIGSYSWFAKGFAVRLDEKIETSSIDLHHRALIIGFCYPSEGRKTTPQKIALFEKHLLWLIANCPGSNFLREFYWDDIEKRDSELKARLNSAWRKIVKSSDDPKVLINACLAHFSNDRATAKKIIEKALKVAPDDLVAAALANRLADRPEEFNAQAQLKKFGFKSGCASQRLTKFSESFDTWACEIFGRYLPDRAIWTLEQILRNNANDLGARAEILGFFSDFHYCNALDGPGPAISAQRLLQQLWVLQNIPATPKIHALYASNSEDKNCSLAMIAAWKMQIDSYPREPQIAINASRVFCSNTDFYQDGLNILERSVKQNPRSAELKECLVYLLKIDRDHSDRIERNKLWASTQKKSKK